MSFAPGGAALQLIHNAPGDRQPIPRIPAAQIDALNFYLPQCEQQGGLVVARWGNEQSDSWPPCGILMFDCGFDSQSHRPVLELSGRSSNGIARLWRPLHLSHTNPSRVVFGNVQSQLKLKKHSDTQLDEMETIAPASQHEGETNEGCYSSEEGSTNEGAGAGTGTAAASPTFAAAASSVVQPGEGEKVPYVTPADSVDVLETIELPLGYCCFAGSEGRSRTIYHIVYIEPINEVRTIKQKVYVNKTQLQEPLIVQRRGQRAQAPEASEPSDPELEQPD